MRKKYRGFLMGILIAGILSGCQSQETGTADPGQETVDETQETVDEAQEIADAARESSEAVSEMTADVLLESDLFTDRDKEIGYDETSCVTIVLADEGSSCDSGNVIIEGSQITIQEEGTYRLTGSLTDGQIIIDAENTDKIHLILDGVSVTCPDSAAVYIKQADKVFCTLAADTVNTLANTGGFTKEEDDNVDAAVFSKDDLTWNGTGTLKIQSEGNGMTSKDDLAVTGGVYEIASSGHGIEGKESVRIADGTFTITSGKDGIHAEDKDDASNGFIYIADGTFVITADGDGMDAATILQADGGTVTVTAGGGSAQADMDSKSQENGFGRGDWNTDTESAGTEETDTVSTKGLKAGQMLRILQGTYEVDTLDDAMHSNGDIEVTEGTFLLSSGDDAVHADGAVTIGGGTMEIPICYEGIEGKTILVQGGEISLTAADDGMNAASGEESGGGFGMEANEENWIRIEGGTLTICADGDGIDSNGDLYVSGGTIFLSGPTSGGDGSLDYAGTAEITGGTVIAAARNGMEENFGDTSSQGSILVTTSSMQEAGSTVSLQDEAGNVLVSYSPEKSYNSILVSCPDITVGNTYIIMAGEESVTVEMTELIYGSGSMEAGGQRGFGGRKGDTMPQGGMERPDGETLPEGETPPEGMERPEGEMPPKGMERPEGETLPEGMERPGRGAPSEGTDQSGQETLPDNEALT